MADRTSVVNAQDKECIVFAHFQSGQGQSDLGFDEQLAIHLHQPLVKASLARSIPHTSKAAYVTYQFMLHAESEAYQITNQNACQAPKQQLEIARLLSDPLVPCNLCRRLQNIVNPLPELVLAVSKQSRISRDERVALNMVRDCLATRSLDAGTMLLLKGEEILLGLQHNPRLNCIPDLELHANHMATSLGPLHEYVVETNMELLNSMRREHYLVQDKSSISLKQSQLLRGLKDVIRTTADGGLSSKVVSNYSAQKYILRLENWQQRDEICAQESAMIAYMKRRRTLRAKPTLR